MNKITEVMTVSQILDLDEKLAEVLEENFMFCGGCSAATSETLKEAAEGHGIDLEKLLDKLNQAI